MSSTPNLIALDFDGVLHQAVSPFTDVLTIPDPPVTGAIEWLVDIVEEYGVIIHSSRLAWDPSALFHSDTAIGDRVFAIRKWLYKNGCPLVVIDELEFHTGPGKPHAWIYIDDRGFNFRGKFPTRHQLENFNAWKYSPKPGLQMRQSVAGMMSNVREAVRSDVGGSFIELEQMIEHLGIMKRQYEAGDVGVVDEFFALYTDLEPK